MSQSCPSLTTFRIFCVPEYSTPLFLSLCDFSSGLVQMRFNQVQSLLFKNKPQIRISSWPHKDYCKRNSILLYILFEKMKENTVHLEKHTTNTNTVNKICKINLCSTLLSPLKFGQPFIYSELRNLCLDLSLMVELTKAHIG